MKDKKQEAIEAALSTLALQIAAYENVLKEIKKDIKSPYDLNKYLGEKDLLRQLKKHQKKLQNELRK